MTAEHRELKDLTLARDVGPAIEALAHHINSPQSELIAYAHRHGLDDLTEPPSSDD